MGIGLALPPPLLACLPLQSRLTTACATLERTLLSPFGQPFSHSGGLVGNYAHTTSRQADHTPSEIAYFSHIRTYTQLLPLFYPLSSIWISSHSPLLSFHLQVLPLSLVVHAFGDTMSGKPLPELTPIPPHTIYDAFTCRSPTNTTCRHSSQIPKHQVARPQPTTLHSFTEWVTCKDCVLTLSRESVLKRGLVWHSPPPFLASRFNRSPLPLAPL